MCRAFAEQIARLPCLLAQIALFVKAETSVGSAQTRCGDPISGVTIRRRRKAGARPRRRVIYRCKLLKVFEYIDFVDRDARWIPEDRAPVGGVTNATSREFSLHFS
jgi:hypothetical protein